MNKISGISLIVLVITIIVIIILAGAVILSLSQNNPVAKSEEAVFKTNVNEYRSELQIAISNDYLDRVSTKINATVWDGLDTDIDGTVKQYITIINAKDGANFEIQNNELVYVGDDPKEKGYIDNMGLKRGNKTPIGLGVNKIATKNSTVNGLSPSYNNPIIPKGFKAVNTTGAVWDNATPDWNNGLVIEDNFSNQFVWIPVDGTNVKYEKWCTKGVSYTSTLPDSLPSPLAIDDEIDQITKYGGFYIGRYEAVFDYNSGSIRAASKGSTGKTTSDWSTNRINTYNGYLWNRINYTDAKYYSENMAASYNYDINLIKTGLVTGSQWDTTMKWLQSQSISVDGDSSSWGNYNNATFTYEYPTTSTKAANSSVLLNTGAALRNSVKNIYDLAGNVWEWTNEISASSRAYRGGSCLLNGATYTASHRVTASSLNYIDGVVGFRVVLYVL